MQEAEKPPPLVLVSSSRVVKPRRSSGSGSNSSGGGGGRGSSRTDTEAGSIIRLSTCDLALPNVYAMAIFAFRVRDGLGDEQVDAVEELEKGLSQALDEYPEWAGRLRERQDEEHDQEPGTVIELTGDGVVLIDATMMGATRLADLMPFDPSPLLFSLVPDTQNVDQLLLVQVTRFNCGGFVLGVAWHHRLADGQAFFGFMDNWSRITRRAPMAAAPYHDRSALLVTASDHSPPPDEYLLLSRPPSPPRPPPVLQARKFHFASTALERIRQQARGLGGDEQPVTRFVGLTAHLWRCITRARSLDAGVSTRIMIPMDGRSRLRPRLPASYFGNATFAPWTSKVEAGELLSQPLAFAAKLVREAIAKADDGYLRSALELMRRQQRRSWAQDASELAVPPGMSPDVCVSSWVRFPLYDVDFGLGGPPLFVGNVLQLFEGIMVLLPSYTRDGSIDAVVALEQPAMAKLEQELAMDGSDSISAQRSRGTVNL